MALTAAWNAVGKRFQDLERHEDIRPIVVAMHRLVAALREDPRFSDIEPSVSLGSLNLRLSDSERYVNAVWNADEPPGFKVSFVDPSLEFHETKKVDEGKVVATILEYLDCLRRQ
ncbi:MAG TPA: hypothetical protein VIT23_16765 [Terrimicrobiaceae bacterium]